MVKKLKNIHPGEILLEEFLQPLGISQNAAGNAMGVSPRRINEICLGKRGIITDTAIRLSRFFGTSTYFWLGLQNDYDLEQHQDDGIYIAIKPYMGGADSRAKNC